MIVAILFLFVLIAGIIIVEYWWVFLLIAGFFVGLFFFCWAVTKRTCPICKTRYSKMTNKNCPKCDGIDFDNIAFCKIEDENTTYRRKEEINREIYYYDDAPQELYTTTYHLIPNGVEYTFLVVYKNGRRSEFRKYKDSTPFFARLMEKTVEFSKTDNGESDGR